MSAFPIIAAKGRMTDRDYFDAKTCLVAAINSSSHKASGIAKDLGDIYPHANLFEERKQLYNLNRAIWYDRPSVGTIVVKEPPSSPKSNYPYVVGLVTQFGPGDSIEYNNAAKYFVENSRDVHYVNGLMLDRKENRRENFKRCLHQLSSYVMQNKNISKVVLPSGVGRRGKTDGEWKTYYFSELKNMAQQLDLNGIQVVILEQDSPWDEESGNGGGDDSIGHDTASRARL